jgi:hypothetical protein
VLSPGTSAGSGVLAADAWVEVAQLDALLAAAGRPCFVSFKSSRPQAVASAQVGSKVHAKRGLFW